MKVSIEISTFNNKEILGQVLERLAAQTFPADQFEVVLSDDGSTDGLPEMVETMSAGLSYRLRMLKHEHQGPAHAHNCGIRAAEADIVIMLAADILPSPDLVDEHVRSHLEHPAINVVVSGRLVQSPELQDTLFQKSWDKRINKLFSSEKKDLRHGFFFVSNLSFKKKFMLEHGMFLDWPPAAQEDLELGYRLKQHGMQLIHNVRALGFHHHPVTLQQVARRAYTQGFNWHYFESHVPEMWIRMRSGNVIPSDGTAVFCRTLLWHAVRNLLINDFTIFALMIPLLKTANRLHLLSPLVPMLISKVTVYYFYQGLRDYKYRVRFDPGRIIL